MNAVVDWLLAVPAPVAYVVIGALVFTEAALFVGFVLPGETAVLVGGVLAASGRLNLVVLLILVVTAAILGDSVGYEVGRVLGTRVLESPRLRRSRKRLEGAQRFLRERGGAAVFLARFTAFLRAVTPALAGTSGMPYPRFLAFNAAGGIVWGTGVALLGFFAGQSYAAVERVLGRTSAVLLAVLLVVAFVVWHRRRRRARVEGEASDAEEPPVHDPAAAPWWTRAVVYQVYPRSFQDSDGDGIGDLGGVLQRLDHLADLGVDVLWLSPVYPSPQADNGYDICDYQDVDPLFGTLAQVDELIAALHARGMKLVMDLVVNHTSDEHPWFVESRTGPDSPKRDWYWWRPPRAGMAAGDPGAEPTNWASFFSGPAWELDPAGGEYYLHLFDRKQPDLNWENPEVRQAVFAMMRWWLDRGVDGFRMDVINMISKDVGPDGELSDGPPIPGSSLGDGSVSYLCGPRIHDYLQEMHREVFAGHDDRLLLVGEMPGVTVDQARLFTDPARAEVDMVFQFEHVDLDHGLSKWDVRPLRIRDLKASFGRWQAGLGEVGWNSLYWDNHDQPRAVSRFGDDSPEHRRDSATCLATLLHLHRGTPYVYQGEEIGMANYPFKRIEDFRDIESVNHFVQAVSAGQDPDEVLAALRAMSRDNARTPVQWDASPSAGFTTGTPWLPVNPDHEEWNAERQRADDGSVLAHYRRLIALRHELPVVALGDFTMLLPHSEEVYAFRRELGGDRLLVVCNVGGRPCALDRLLPEAVDADLVLGNLPVADPAVLAPWEARVLRPRAAAA